MGKCRGEVMRRQAGARHQTHRQAEPALGRATIFKTKAVLASGQDRRCCQ
jgi:hypothetical protein